MTKLSKLDSNFNDENIQETCQPDSNHPGIVLRNSLVWIYNDQYIKEKGLK